MIEPLVSVIMPCFNYAALLPRAVASVQAQTETDWELLIVDDGSTDNSVDVANKLAKLDDRIRVLPQEENRKLAATRNAGFRAARGRYIMLLDADDEYLPHAMQRLLSWMTSHPETALAYGNFCWEDGRPGTGEPYSWEGLAHHDFIPCQAVMLDRYALQYVGGNDGSLARAEDWDHWLRFAAITDGAIHYLGAEPLYILHVHDKQGTKDEAGMRAHDPILRKRAAAYRAALSAPIKVVHASFPLNPHGAQGVLQQIIEGTPDIQHEIRVTEVGKAGDEEAKRLRNVVGITPTHQIAQARADCYHIHDWANQHIMKWLEAGPSAPVLLTNHGLTMPIPNELPIGFRQNIVWPSPLINTGRTYVVSVPNGVALAKLPPVRSGSLDCPCVGTVSRFAVGKRCHLFWETCVELARRQPYHYVFRFVGGSDWEAEFKQSWALIQQLGNAGEAVQWVRETKHETVLDQVAGMDVFLSCSASETRPLSIMEAVALGSKVVATDVGGISTIQGITELLPLSAGPTEWAAAAWKYLTGAKAPRRPPDQDGKIMATRYRQLYRAMVLEGRMKCSQTIRL